MRQDYSRTAEGMAMIRALEPGGQEFLATRPLSYLRIVVCERI